MGEILGKYKGFVNCNFLGNVSVALYSSCANYQLWIQLERKKQKNMQICEESKKIKFKL
jgi:hypothetical protein